MTRQHDDITKVPVVRAAKLLGITEGAVRQRIKRGTLPIEKTQDGSVYVLLNASHDRTNTDNTRTNSDNDGDNTTDLRLTVERLDSEVAFLRSELVTRNEELRRKDHIIAALTERIPELEAPRERRESDLTATESDESSAMPQNEQEPKSEPERRSWWRRLFDLPT
jgi:hypothetical protein